MKYLIVGLGNIGEEYAHTRHNIGFDVVDNMARVGEVKFEDKRYGFIAKMRVKNKILYLLKPSTYMNLSGNAVRYWMEKEHIPLENVLVIVDDLSLPFGSLRLRAGGSEAGHNGLKSITQQIGTQKYARLRFGIGNDFPRGRQVDFVLGHFNDDDLAKMEERLQTASEAVKSFALSGLSFAMNHYNNK